MSLTQPQFQTAQAPTESGHQETVAISAEQIALREQVNDKIYNFP